MLNRNSVSGTSINGLALSADRLNGERAKADTAEGQVSSCIQEEKKIDPSSRPSKRPQSLYPPVPPAGAGVQGTSPERDPEANFQKAVLSHLPKEWNEIKTAIEQANGRPIDTAALAQLFSELDLINVCSIKKGRLKPTAALFRQFDEPSTFGRLCNAMGVNPQNLEQFDKHYLSKWCESIGMRPEDHSAQQQAQRLSAFLLNAARLPSTALQYTIVPALGMVTHDPWNTAYASVALAFANVIINALPYPFLTATSGHLQARNGPSVNLSKEVNYKHRSQVETEKTRTKTRELEEKNEQLLARLQHDDFATHLQPLLGDKPFTKAELHEVIAKLETLKPAQITSQKEKLEPILEDLESLYRSGLELIDQCRILSMTEANVIRQREGTKHKFWLSVSRPMLASVPPLFARRPGGLSSTSVMLFSVGIVIATMLVQYIFLAPRDQKSKGDAKHKLNILYADIFNESGKEKIAAGVMLGPDDFDEDKLLGLITTSAEAMLTRAVNLTEKEIGQLPQDQRGKVEAALQAWKKKQDDGATSRADAVKGAWKALDDAQPIVNKVTEVAERFRGGGLWSAAVKANYTRSEIVDEMVRSFSRSFHIFFLGSAAANSVPRIVNAAYGGASKVPLPGYFGLLVFSLFSAYLGASSEDVSTTYTNI